MNFPFSISAEVLVKPVTFFGGLCFGYLIGVVIFRRTSKSDTIGDSMQNQVQGIAEAPIHTVALVVNSSLKMGKGKIAAQCGHAILSLCKRARKNSKGLVKLWNEGGRDIKIVSVKSTEDFDYLEQMVEMESLDHYLVADAGRTQIKGGSLTVLGIGPGTVDSIDRVVGQLPIYS